MIYKTLTFRLYPTKQQSVLVERALDLHRELYNAALEERRTAWERCRVSVSWLDQSKQLKDLWKARPDIKATISAQSAQQTIRKLDFAFQSFFRRVKNGETPGYPRFKNRRAFASFSLTSQETVCEQYTLRLPKLGHVKWKPWCVFPGVAKKVSISRKPDGYYASVCFECPDPSPFPPTGRTVGIDLGMESVVSTSDDEFVPTQRLAKETEKKLRRLHRVVSRRKKGSNRRRKAVQVLAKFNQKTARRRKHFLDNISKELVERYDVVAVEDLQPQKMKRLGGRGSKGRGFRRAFADAAWGELLRQIDYKAAWAGRRVVRVPAAGTSQECSECGAIVRKGLNVRVHSCPECGLVLDRDINAARNIHQRALQALRGEEAL